MFIVIMMTVVTLMQGYVWWHLGRLPWLTRRVSVQTLYRIGALCWGLLFVDRLWRPEAESGWAWALEYFGMAWLGIAFLLFVHFLALDLVTGAGRWWLRWQTALRTAALMSGLAASLWGLYQGMQPPVVVAHEVRLPQLPRALDGTVVVAMSDMHVGPVLDARWIAARVAQVQAEKPDVILLLGDIFEGYAPPTAAMLAEFRQLHAPLGVWAIMGNHEGYGPQPPEPTALFRSAGAELLRNRWAEIRPGLVLAGLDNTTSQAQADVFATQALRQHPQYAATLLLSHEPHLPSAAARHGAEVMLSGHTHGGQIWPFGYLVQQRFPLLNGRYNLPDLSVIVLQGTGTWGPRMRLGTQAEILRITLRSGR